VANQGPTVIAVTGLAFEARIARRSGVTVIFDGDRRRLVAALEYALACGSRGIISFGIAGGLAYDFALGDLVVASEIATEKGRFPTDPIWSNRIRQAVPHARSAVIVGVDAAVADSPTKRALHQRTGAAVVDMESHVAAEVAEAYRVPFAAVRVVADPVHRVLPEAALIPLRADGRPDIPVILGSVAANVRQVPGLVRLALDAYVARRTLLRSRKLLGPGLCFPDLAECRFDMA
jgi:adenosylhomocysteine nucleosidase